MAWRALRAATAFAERWGLIRATPMPAPDLGFTMQPWISPPRLQDASAYLAAADRIAEGWLDVHGLREVDMGSPPRWNRDPRTGIEAPLAFGKTLDCADPDLVGDIEYLRQPNRHQHLVRLAQAWALAGRPRHGEALAEHLESWVIACPCGRGANWSSALEAALRLANWSAAWQIIGGPGSALFARHASLRAAWLRSAYEHAEFIRGWLSVHTQEPVRLVCEAAGLFLASLTWPHWPRAREWRASAKRILEEVSSRAFHPRAAELLLACLIAGKANNEWFSADFETRVEAMLDYVAAIMDAAGQVPLLGEPLAGFALQLSPEPGFCANRSLLATGAVLFRRGDFKLKAGRLDDKARWLLGAGADARYEELDVEKTRLPVRQSFPERGAYVLGAEFDTPGELRLVANAPGLDFTLSAGGRELLVDPGSYADEARNPWRRYFNSTGARNCVRVDGLERAAARSGCSLWLCGAEKDTFEGWHDGYLGLADPVKHRRLIDVYKAARRVVLEDTLEMEAEHEVELFFHCHEGCRVEPAQEGFVISRDGVSVRLRLPQAEGARILVYRGSVAPVAGWVSRRFDAREPAPTLVWQARLRGRSLLRSEIQPIG